MSIRLEYLFIHTFASDNILSRDNSEISRFQSFVTLSHYGQPKGASKLETYLQGPKKTIRRYSDNYRQHDAHTYFVARSLKKRTSRTVLSIYNTTI